MEFQTVPADADLAVCPHSSPGLGLAGQPDEGTVSSPVFT